MVAEPLQANIPFGPSGDDSNPVVPARLEAIEPIPEAAGMLPLVNRMAA